MNAASRWHTTPIAESALRELRKARSTCDWRGWRFITRNLRRRAQVRIGALNPRYART